MLLVLSKLLSASVIRVLYRFTMVRNKDHFNSPLAQDRSGKLRIINLDIGYPLLLSYGHAFWSSKLQLEGARLSLTFEPYTKVCSRPHCWEHTSISFNRPGLIDEWNKGNDSRLTSNSSLHWSSESTHNNRKGIKPSNFNQSFSASVAKKHLGLNHTRLSSLLLSSQVPAISTCFAVAVEQSLPERIKLSATAPSLIWPSERMFGPSSILPSSFLPQGNSFHVRYIESKILSVSLLPQAS